MTVKLADSSFSDRVNRLCEVCAEPIPPARLRAIPDTQVCVRCLEECGDVPLLRRHDDYFGKEAEDFVSTYYHSNLYLDTPLKGVLAGWSVKENTDDGDSPVLNSFHTMAQFEQELRTMDDIRLMELDFTLDAPNQDYYE